MDRYRLAQARECFPYLADPVIQDWVRRGYLAHEVEERGRRTYVTFSVPELIHLGVIGQLSVLGALRNPRYAKVGDDSGLAFMSLQFPERMIARYEQLNYEAVALVYPLLFTTPTKNRRSKQQHVQFAIFVNSLKSVENQFGSWHEWMLVSAETVALISVQKIRISVLRTLGIED